jgi:hypothetical protein
MRKNKIFQYSLLIGLTIIYSFLFMLLFIRVFDDRITGIAWGFCSSIIIAKITALIILRIPLPIIVVRVFFYSIFVFIIFYILYNIILSNYNTHSIFTFVLPVAVMLASYEVTNFITDILFKKENI